MITRRRFCIGAGCGLAALGVGCANDPRVSVGGIDDPPGTNLPNPEVDLGGGNQGTPDLASGQQPDLAHGTTTASCPNDPLNAGAATAIAMNGYKRFTDNQTYDLFVCRDAGGLFAVDAECTHEGCVLKLSSGRWFCNCHGARFNFDGTKPTSPAHSPLNNYAVCIDASGTVWVDYNSLTTPTARA
jgi:nitrite reductase/ring-hydroxylating ferredoxin subunit